MHRAGAFLLLSLASLVGAQSPQLSIEPLPDGRVRLLWPVGDTALELQSSPGLPPAGTFQPVAARPTIANATAEVVVTPGASQQFYRLQRAAAVLPTVESSSPASGETGVAVTRETIFRLTAPLAADAVVGADRLQVEFGGRQLLSRAEIAADRRSVTLFLLENLPAAARLATVFDLSGLKDAGGREFDGDGDGVAGGRAVVNFETAGVTGLPGTAVEGRVFASETGPGGTNLPLAGVTVTVDGAEEVLRATTDATGYFRLDPSPAGRFFVHVDGRTATGSQWPGGAYYPFVGKAWEAVAGKTNNLAGGSGVVFLPKVAGDALRPVSANQDTTVQFPSGVLATNPALAGVEVRVPANSLFADDGTRGGRVGLAPVAPDRLPEPLPPGLNLPLVITIQTDGPMNFDRPVPVRFPNLPDPVTGRITPPGAKTILWSFNHDTGRWEAQGTATITPDGRFAETDPGVGVRQPGWQGVAEGSPAEGPTPKPPEPPEPPEPNEPEEPEDDPCEGQNGRFDCDGDGCAESDEECEDECKKKAEEVERIEPYCPLSRAINNVVDTAVCNLPVFSWATGCPDDAWISKMKECRDQLGDAKADYDLCLIKRGGASESPILRRRAARQDAASALADQTALIEAGALPYQLLLGAPAWTLIEPDDFPVAAAFFTALGTAMDSASPGGRQITPAERTALLAVPRPGNLTPALVATALDRLNAYTGGTLPAAELQAVEAAVAARETLWNSYRARGWRTPYDGLLEYERLNSTASAESALFTFFPRRRLWYEIRNPVTGDSFRGRLDSRGRFAQVILPANTYFEVAYVDPVTLTLGTAVFRSGAAGETTRIPAVPMIRTRGFVDADGDGLADAVEKVVGTRPDKADSDDDGATDRQEIQAGLNPLDGQVTSQGVVAALRTQGTPRDLAITGNILAVADGAAGVLLVDVSDPLRPLVLNRVPLGGPTLAVAADGNRVAVALGTTGVAVIDVTDPRRPRVLWESRVVGGSTVSVTALALRGSLLLAGTSNAELLVLETSTGALRQRLPLPFGTSNTQAGQIHLDGEVAYVVNNHPSDRLNVSHLVTLALDGDVVTPLGAGLVQRGIPPTGINRRFAVGGGYAYLGYIGGYYAYDVRNPASPTLVGRPASDGQGVLSPVLDGSGRLLALTTFGSGLTADLSVYNIQNPTNTTVLTRSFPLDRLAWASRMHRGYVLVADNVGNLRTVNAGAPDLGTNAPSLDPRVTELPSLPGAPRRFLVDAGATDDLQVRDAEVLVDGRRVAFDGAYPFQMTFTIPPPAPGQAPPPVTVRATDRAGNASSRRLDFTDRTPPALVHYTPAAGESASDSLPVRVELTFNEPLAPASVPADVVQILGPGADFQLGTADDVPIGLVPPVLSGDGRTLTVLTVTNLPFREHQVTLRAGLADAAGNARVRPISWNFRVVGGKPFPSLLFPETQWVEAGGSLPPIEVEFDAILPADELARLTVQLFRPGPDGNLGTGDDQPVSPLEVRYQPVGRILRVTPPAGTGAGRYRLQIAGPMYGLNPFRRDLALATLPNNWVGPAGGLWSAVANWSRGPIWPNDTLIIPPGLAGTTNDVQVPIRSFDSSSPLRVERNLTLAGTGLARAGLTLREGRLSGGGVLEAWGGLDIDSTIFANTAVTLTDLTVVNRGLARFNSGILQVDATSGRWRNEPGATLELRPGASRFAASGSSGIRGRLENRGLITKPGGTNSFSFDGVQVLNDGRIEVGAGTLVLPAYEGAGALHVAGGARLVFNLTSRLRNGTTVTGPGEVVFGDQTSTTIFRADAEVDGDYRPTGLTRLVAGRLAFARGLDLPAGRMETRADLSSNPGVTGLEFLAPVRLAELSIRGSAGARLEARADLGRLVLGAGVLSGPGSLRVNELEWNGGSLAPGGVLEVAETLKLGGTRGRFQGRTVRLLPGATAVVTNSVGFETAAGPGTLDIRGSLLVSSNLLFTLPAFLENAGNIELQGTLDLNPLAANPPVGRWAMRPGGRLRLLGGQLRVGTNSLLLPAGEISGAGRVLRAGRSTVIVTNAGVLRLDHPTAPLEWVDHTLTQAPTGEIAVHLGPVGVGRTTVSGSGTRVTLGGRLRLVVEPGFDPPLGTSYTILTAPVVTGSFATVEGNTLPGGRRFDVRTESNQVRLVVVN